MKGLYQILLVFVIILTVLDLSLTKGSFHYRVLHLVNMSTLIHKQIKDAIEGANHILLITDERIDGDTIGSTLGMFHVLREMGKKVQVYSPKPIVESLEFLPGVLDIQRESDIFNDASIDLAMVFDCADGLHFKEHIKKLPVGTKLIVIDHHETNPCYGHMNLVEPDSASTADVVWRMVQYAGFKMNKNAAQCILTGITTDTHAFMTSNTTSECLDAAHELAKHGAKLQEIVRHTMMNKSVATLKLWGLAFERLYEDENFGALTTVITRKDIKRLGVTELEGKSMINFLNAMIDGVDTVLVLRETDDGGVKASMRSQTTDVAAIAKKHGGGGHTRAAGFKVENAHLEEKDGKWEIVKN